MTAQVFLRPLANPLPLGFLALAGGTLLVSGLQLDWLAPEEGSQVDLILIAFVFPLQLVASVFGALAMLVAGIVGLLLFAVAVYAALAMALEDAQGRRVLPLGRAEPIDAEAGVRPQL